MKCPELPGKAHVFSALLITPHPSSVGVRPQKAWDHRAVGSMQALSGSQDALFCQLFLQCLSLALQQCTQSCNPVEVVDGSAKTIF